MSLELTIDSQKDRANGPYALTITKEHWPLQLWVYDLSTRLKGLQRACDQETKEVYAPGKYTSLRTIREWGTLFFSQYGYTPERGKGEREAIKQLLKKEFQPDDTHSEDLWTHITNQLKGMQPLFLIPLEEKRKPLGYQLCAVRTEVSETDWDTLVLPSEKSPSPATYPISNETVTGRRIKNKKALRAIETRLSSSNTPYLLTFQTAGMHFKGHARDTNKWQFGPALSEEALAEFYQELYDEAHRHSEETRLHPSAYRQLRTILDLA